jgi:hypothetical protein
MMARRAEFMVHILPSELNSYATDIISMLFYVVGCRLLQPYYEEYYDLGNNAMKSAETKPTFQKNVSLPSSGSKISQAKNQLVVGS